MPDASHTQNLDWLAAKQAQEIVDTAQEKGLSTTADRLATKALGVLQAQGVYALMLFLFSRSSDEAKVAPAMRQGLYAALRELPDFEGVSISDSNPGKVLEFYTESVVSDLDRLLLVRDLYEQTLIYARFGAKADTG